MSKTIDYKILDLKPEQKKEFFTNLVNVMHSRNWCHFHNIEYANPSMDKAREELYLEMFEQ